MNQILFSDQDLSLSAGQQSAFSPAVLPLCNPATRQPCSFSMAKSAIRNPQSAIDPIRILVVDDHTLFREGLAALLNNAPNLEVVGEAATGREAIAQAGALLPDVVLMDIQMPDMNGIEATRSILAAHSGIGVVMITMLEDDDSLFAAMRAGARGYILKGADKAEVLQTVTAVAEGQALFGPAIAVG